MTDISFPNHCFSSHRCSNQHFLRWVRQRLQGHIADGFSMIELLVVVTIIIVITTVGLVSYTSANQNSRNAKRKADAASIRNALVLYRAENGQYPDTNDFDTMLSTISDYIDEQGLEDPGNYSYAYWTSGDPSCFTLQMRLEPDAEFYRVRCP